MNKYWCILLCLHFSIIGFAQKFEASKFTYKSLVYSDAHFESTDELYFLDTNKTIYVRGVISFMESHPKPEEGVIVMPLDSSIGDFIYINDFKINQLISKVDDFKVYYIREDIPNFKWQLQEEYKNINGVNLQKATTHFRGRNYTAWCDLETPISIGPWKFNNLPGLAYEITDDNNEFYNEWFLSQINFEKEVDLKPYKIDLSKTIHLIDFVHKKDDIYNIVQESVFIRNSEIQGMEKVESSSNKINNRIRALEIKYEWED